MISIYTYIYHISLCYGYVLCFYIFIEPIQHYAYMSYVNDTYSYQILNPKGIKGIEDPKKCTKILIESTELAEDQYRLGNTKARNIFSFYTQKLYFEQKQMQIQKTLSSMAPKLMSRHARTNTCTYTHPIRKEAVPE